MFYLSCHVVTWMLGEWYVLITACMAMWPGDEKSWYYDVVLLKASEKVSRHVIDACSIDAVTL